MISVTLVMPTIRVSNEVWDRLESLVQAKSETIRAEQGIDNLNGVTLSDVVNWLITSTARHYKVVV